MKRNSQKSAAAGSPAEQDHHVKDIALCITLTAPYPHKSRRLRHFLVFPVFYLNSSRAAPRDGISTSLQPRYAGSSLRYDKQREFKFKKDNLTEVPKVSYIDKH